MIEILDQYQELAQRTRAGFRENLVLTPDDQDLLLGVIGLAGEAGEALEIIKKWLFHGHELDREALIKEAGDAGWYWAQLATGLKLNLSEVATRNIDKLKKRYPEGFSTEQSLLRCVCGHHKDDHAPLAEYDPYQNGAMPCTQCNCQDFNQAHQLGVDGSETPVHTPR